MSPDAPVRTPALAVFAASLGDDRLRRMVARKSTQGVLARNNEDSGH
jgi:hypothetical protein